MTQEQIAWDIAKILITGLLTGAVAYFIAHVAARKQMDTADLQSKCEKRREVYLSLCRLRFLVVDYTERSVTKHIWARFWFHQDQKDINSANYRENLRASETFEVKALESLGAIWGNIHLLETLFPSEVKLDRAVQSVLEVVLPKYDDGARAREKDSKLLKESPVEWREQEVAERKAMVQAQVGEPLTKLLGLLKDQLR